MKKLIYIGYDPREQEAYNVAKFSVIRRTDPSKTTVIPLKLQDLKHLLWRPIENKDGRLWCPISEAYMSTEFAISRFTVPLLCTDGWTVFMDCDMLCRTNIDEVFDLVDDKYAVMVVKHKQESGSATKMDGQVQAFYTRKNWSSMMLFNCDHPSNRKLTTEILNSWPGRDLHAFKWLKDEEIGELPAEWNYLVGVNPPIKTPKLIHFTLGTPNIPTYEHCEFSDEWRKELELCQ